MKFVKEKYFVRKYSSIESKSICKVRPDGAPDGVKAKVGEGDHQVDVKVDGYDMPMSIYSQYFSSLRKS